MTPDMDPNEKIRMGVSACLLGQSVRYDDGHCRNRYITVMSHSTRHYRDGLAPLLVPVTLLNHYMRKYEQGYLADQIYLTPHPAELKLCNHA